MILRINSNIHATETFINRLSTFLKVGLSSPVHNSRTTQWRRHTRMDPWVFFISQVCTNAFFGKVTDSKREKLEMRALWVRTFWWTKMPLMSENGTSRIEFISKFYQKAWRNKQTNQPWQSEENSFTPTLKTWVIALQAELVFWCTDLFCNKYRKFKLCIRHSNISYSSHGGDLQVHQAEYGLGYD